MKITVNAQERDVTAATLSLILSELGFTSRAIATAVNGRFVPATARNSTAIAAGDQIEVLAPMQGG